ncbi:hypothetical protein J6A31_07950 [bacterium]|nr:hypothetical protein [bacterium]
MRDFFKNKYLEALSVNRASICILIFILCVLLATGGLGDFARLYKLSSGYKRTIHILNEVMQITDFERDKTFTSGTLIHMYIVDALFSRYKGVDCQRNKKNDDVCKEIAPYKTYNGNSDISQDIYSGGLSIAIGKILLRFSSPERTDDPVYIMADVNGPQQLPNRLGYDVFVFEIVDAKLKHEGDPLTTYPLSSNAFYCSSYSTSKSDLQGINCAYKLMNDKSYFKKLDLKKIEKEMKKHH